MYSMSLATCIQRAMLQGAYRYQTEYRHLSLHIGVQAWSEVWLTSRIECCLEAAATILGYRDSRYGSGARLAQKELAPAIPRSPANEAMDFRKQTRPDARHYG